MEEQGGMKEGNKQNISGQKNHTKESKRKK
jgi:hypothetical protein